MSMALKPITTLRTAVRDVRVTAAGLLQARQMLPAMRMVEFAQAMLQCYDRQPWLWQALNLIFRQFRTPVNLENVHHHSHTHLAPRLALTVVRKLAQPERQQAAGAFIPALQRAIANTSGSAASSYLIDREHLVYRLSARYQRVTENEQVMLVHQSRQMKDTASEVAMPGRFELPIMETVSRVFRRAKPIVNESGISSPSERGFRATPQEDKSATKLASPPAAAIDVNRLADQVIQTIDRRIVAQRERLGRF